MESFQERQNLKVRKQEAIEQLLLFLFLLLGGLFGRNFYCWNSYASVTSHGLSFMMTT